MPSKSHRKVNAPVVAAELAGQSWFGGAPCRKNPEHILEDGTTKRDTVKRTCLGCDHRVREMDNGA